ncbi:MAG TPA: hypothetical protein VFV19_02990 [Candidatus Polarisedimenticolaceae bacterium]|nr:hypothetical protein [Candidatus Polarisedimenticolaceae bacterium]
MINLPADLCQELDELRRRVYHLGSVPEAVAAINNGAWPAIKAALRAGSKLTLEDRDGCDAVTLSAEDLESNNGRTSARSTHMTSNHSTMTPTRAKKIVLEQIGDYKRAHNCDYETAVEAIKANMPAIYKLALESYANFSATGDQAAVDKFLPATFVGPLVARHELAQLVEELLDRGIASNPPDALKQIATKNPDLVERARGQVVPTPSAPDGNRKLSSQERAGMHGPNEERLLLEAKRIEAERNIGFGDALDVVKQENPALYAAGMRDRGEARTEPERPVVQLSAAEKRSATDEMREFIQRAFANGRVPANDFIAGVALAAREQPELHARFQAAYRH